VEGLLELHQDARSGRQPGVVNKYRSKANLRFLAGTGGPPPHRYSSSPFTPRLDSWQTHLSIGTVDSHKPGAPVRAMSSK
jgi:hypothetical protein